jgi:hypothetical protein
MEHTQGSRLLIHFKVLCQHSHTATIQEKPQVTLKDGGKASEFGIS